MRGRASSEGRLREHAGGGIRAHHLRLRLVSGREEGWEREGVSVCVCVLGREGEREGGGGGREGERLDACPLPFPAILPVSSKLPPSNEMEERNAPLPRT